MQLDNESLQREEAALDEQEILHEQMAKLEADYSAAQRELDSLKTSTGQGMDSRKYQELENKYRFAKQERMELLRTQSVNSQKLLELNEQVKKQELVKERLEHEYFISCSRLYLLQDSKAADGCKQQWKAVRILFEPDGRKELEHPSSSRRVATLAIRVDQDG